MAVMPARGDNAAPKFDSTQPRELERYFRELEHLFANCTIADDKDKKSYARRYADTDTDSLWSSLPEFQDGVTYDDFVKAVTKLYPGADSERRWSLADLDKLLGERSRLGINSIQELGEYYRKFLNITTFLIEKKRIDKVELSRSFVRGLPVELWKRVRMRLQMKLPDQHPDDPFTLTDIYNATSYVLHEPVDVDTYVSTSSPVVPDTSQLVKMEDLKSFAQMLIGALTNNQGSNQSTSSSATASQIRDLLCFFCSEMGHFGRDCHHANEYMNAGKIRKNAEGKIILPGGGFCPRNLPGNSLKDRIDEWHRRNPNQTAAAQLSPAPGSLASGMMYTITPQQLTIPQTTIAANTLSQPSAEDQIATLEREIYELRKRVRFDGVHVPPLRRGPEPTSSNATNNTPSPVANAIPSTSAPNPPPTNTTSSTTEPTASTTTEPVRDSNPGRTIVHPYAAAPENGYAPPHDRNFAAKSKDKDVAYRTYAPIQDPAIAVKVYERSMQTPFITLSSEELLAIAPDVRYKVRDAVTPKRLAERTTATASIVEVEDDPLPSTDAIDPIESRDTSSRHDNTDPPIGAYISTDPIETYYKTLPPGVLPRPIVVSKESHALRSINLMVNARKKIECILDGGCQIIAMSEAVCHYLGIMYDPEIILEMESANRTRDNSLGLARNVPLSVGDITLYFQIHIIREPAYDILLGRPFEVLTEAIVKNFSNEEQTITIKDPNSSRTITVPTAARGPPRFRISHDGPSKPNRDIVEDQDFMLSRN
jgi:hypothetical protein